MASFTPSSELKALNASFLFSCFPTSITRLLAISASIENDGGRIVVGSFSSALIDDDGGRIVVGSFSSALIDEVGGRIVVGSFLRTVM